MQVHSLRFKQSCQPHLPLFKSVRNIVNISAHSFSEVCSFKPQRRNADSQYPSSSLHAQRRNLFAAKMKVHFKYRSSSKVHRGSPLNLQSWPIRKPQGVWRCAKSTVVSGFHCNPSWWALGCLHLWIYPSTDCCSHASGIVSETLEKLYYYFCTKKVA